MTFCRWLLIFFINIIITGQSLASENKIRSASLNIAVASNFTDTLQRIVAAYKKSHPQNSIKVISGSTLTLYTQIINGAPFDIFFAADQKHIDLLIKKDLVFGGDSFIYARGKLVLWSPDRADTRGYLASDNFNYLAIAKPSFAPYGIAAKEVLEKLKLFNKLKSDNRLVYSQNVSEAMHYTANGHVDLGFVALSQIISWQKKRGLDLENEIWVIEDNFYKPIIQKCAILRGVDKRGGREGAQRFLEFVKSKEAKDIIMKYGYK